MSLAEWIKTGIAIFLALAVPGVEIEPDRGPGITLEAQADIFKPGYSTREEGEGMGLIIVKELCALMEISLSLQSPPGRRSRFILDLGNEE